jgi:hypothetical protein
MVTGERVRRVPTGEDGVVLGVGDGVLVQVAFPSGTVWIHPEELEKLPEGAEERLAAGQLGRAEPYGLRLQALYLKHAYRYDPLTGLSSARIEPQLHQVFIAHRVTQKLQPRMILADEVGLGKTIEAGLIIKELRARELINRVLIIVPASLQLQWQSELRSKFNEHFEVLDGAALKFLGKGGVNPWATRQNVICSLPFASNPKRAEQIIDAEWDLIVFDEAHRVRRSLQSANKTRATQAYRLADELKELVNGLLLLTATPMQLHPFELYSLIELVEPGLFPTFDAYNSRRGFLPRLNALMKALRGWNALGPDDQRASIDTNEKLLNELGIRRDKAPLVLGDDRERERVMDVLVTKHPLGAALVRNRKAEVGGFTSRKAVTVPVELESDELRLYEDVAAYLREGYNRARADKNLPLGFVMVTYQKIRYDNLNSAVKQVLFGRSRSENERWVAFRSHYGFDAFYCRSGHEGSHEKGGVEGEGGRFRRNHCVPMPVVDSIEELNEMLKEWDDADDRRRVGNRANSVGVDWAFERALLRPLPVEPFDTALTLTPRVDRYAQVMVRCNQYSVPARFIGHRVRVKLSASTVTVYERNTVVARHQRATGKGVKILDLDHYLEILLRKPGALPGATALAQARASGAFTATHDAF